MRRRPSSGTVFVLACVAFLTAFVAFLVFVSPTLLERTLASAPPKAPQVVASGELDGRAWTAAAIDASAGETGPVVEPEPCLQVDLDGTDGGRLCVQRTGGSLRGLQALAAPDGGAVVYGVVGARIASVELLTGEEPLVVEPSYVDFGFPLGFFAAEVDEGAVVAGARALDRDGALKASATCSTRLPTLSSCSTREH